MSAESKNDVVGVASHALLAPFVSVAKGIPDNWPGECILRFDQRNDGSIYLSYHGINDASHGITINQWRALLGANVKRTHPYQRGRTSITGLRVELEEIIETRRLIGVAVSRLVGLLIIRRCPRPPQRHYPLKDLDHQY